MWNAVLCLQILISGRLNEIRPCLNACGGAARAKLLYQDFMYRLVTQILEGGEVHVRDCYAVFKSAPIFTSGDGDYESLPRAHSPLTPISPDPQVKGILMFATPLVSALSTVACCSRKRTQLSRLVRSQHRRQ